MSVAPGKRRHECRHGRLKPAPHRLGFVVVVAAMAMAQAPQTEPPAVEIGIDKIRLALPGKDRVRFAVTPQIVTRRDVAVRQVAFSQMRIGRIPVYVPPVIERLELKSGVPVTPSKPLEVTIYFRDLESTEELQRIVREGEATISGLVSVEVGVNPLVKLVLFTRQVRSQIRFEKRVEVEIPGGALGRSSALALLRSAGKAMSVLQAGKSQIAPNEDKMRARTLAEPVLVMALTRYELRDRQGAVTMMEVARAGVRIGGRRVMLPHEAAEPWLYDFEVMVGMEGGELRMVTGSVETIVFPHAIWREAIDGKPDESRGWSLRRKQIQLVKSGKAEETTMFGQAGSKRVRVGVRKRASSGNVSVWDLKEPGAAPGDAPKLDLVTDGRQWDRLALFRSQGGEFETVLLGCRLDGSRILFSDPIDSGAFGSPIVTADGIAGMVQEENSGLLLREAFRSLGITESK